MELKKVRRLAAQVLKVGENRVWFDPTKTKEISEALTKEDVRGLIGERAIRKIRSAGHSRGRTRLLKAKKKRGRKRGFGKRRGTKKTRVQKKRKWITTVRSQRKMLRDLREKKTIAKVLYTKLYSLVKGGYFKGKKQIELYIKEHKG
ncbi:MAG: 50S ribosomal protein L19e [Candidatus Diapherotrites archaeon]|nr:50S ribosomal protein L19e [Candidatus Diapherotrites archaeon]